MRTCTNTCTYKLEAFYTRTHTNLTWLAVPEKPSISDSTPVHVFIFNGGQFTTAQVHTHTHKHTHTFTHINIHTHACVCVCVCVCHIVCACAKTGVYVCARSHTFTQTHRHTHAHTHTHACKHMYIHTYTHVQSTCVSFCSFHLVAHPRWANLRSSITGTHQAEYTHTFPGEQWSRPQSGASPV